MQEIILTRIAKTEFSKSFMIDLDEKVFEKIKKYLVTKTSEIEIKKQKFYHHADLIMAIYPDEPIITGRDFFQLEDIVLGTISPSNVSELKQKVTKNYCDKNPKWVIQNQKKILIHCSRFPMLIEYDQEYKETVTSYKFNKFTICLKTTNYVGKKFTYYYVEIRFGLDCLKDENILSKILDLMQEIEKI